MSLLGIEGLDWLQVKKWVDAAALPESLAGIKLHVSRGSGGRGYGPHGADEPMVTVTHFSYPAHYSDWKRDGIDLGISQHRLSLAPLLAGHKHNNRLEQVLFKQDLDIQGYADGVVMDLNDNVIETTMANLFWVTNGVVYSADLSSSGVAGVMRKTVLNALEKQGRVTCIGEYPLDALLSADEVFVTNSLLGVAPVKKISSTRFAIGSVTRRLQESFNS
jgi:4-amino-4-deoxychorismate lyase